MTRMRRPIFLALAAAAGLACGGGGGADGGLDRGGLPDRLGGEERLGGSVQGMLVAPAITAKAVLTGLGADLVLDPHATAADNALAVRDGAAAALADPACASRATVVGNTVTVRFDAGCDRLPAMGVDVTGTVVATLSADPVGGAATAAFELTDLSVNGHPPVDGTASVTVTAGAATQASFSVDTSEGTSALSFDGTVDVTAYEIVVDGDGTFTAGPVTYQLAVAGVTWSVTDCYPSSGSVTISIGRVSETLTFTAETDTFGQAELSQGGLTETIQLPAYGDCP